MKGGRTIYNTSQEEAGVATFISNIVDFRARKFIKDKEGPYITVKESILQEEIRILNMHVPNSTALKNMKHKLIKLQGDINKSITIVGDFNISLSVIDR